MIYHGFIIAGKQDVELPTRDRASGPDPALATVLGTRRDGQARAHSARSLLITVLGEMVLTNGGSAWTQTLVDTMALVGVGEKSTRQAISRLAQRDWLTGETHGRRRHWTLTPGMRELLEHGARRIYGIGDPPEWDERWLLVLAGTAEPRRRTRYRLTTGLGWAGFGSLGPTVWVSPWVARHDEASRVIDETGTPAAIFRAELTAMGDPRAITRRAWDLDVLADRYRAFLTHSQSADPTTDPATAAGDLIRLVHGWRRFPFLDPGLPRTLLASDWPGWPAARRFAELHRRHRTGAQRWWQQTEERYAA
ncbi:MAG: PaaX family transcriptional regulator C-terminal domain-containing protein [Acidimicrobiales bacterium]